MITHDAVSAMRTPSLHHKLLWVGLLILAYLVLELQTAVAETALLKDHILQAQAWHKEHQNLIKDQAQWQQKTQSFLEQRNLIGDSWLQQIEQQAQRYRVRVISMDWSEKTLDSGLPWLPVIFEFQGEFQALVDFMQAVLNLGFWFQPLSMGLSANQEADLTLRWQVDVWQKN
jgi:hypothetical protein